MTVGYTRVSTDEQQANGASLDAQRRSIEAWASQQGVTLSEVATEAGSGKNMYRPELLRIIELLRQSGGTLVVAKLDRLTRSVIDCYKICEQSKREGWNIVFLDLSIDTRTPVGSMMIGMVAVFAQFEREMISQRTKDGMLEKRRQGVQFGPKKDLALEAAVLDLHKRRLGPTAIANVLRCPDRPAGFPTIVRPGLNESTVRAIIARNKKREVITK